MYECTLTQLSSSHNHVRTKVIEGKCQELPTVGLRFIMVGPPLDPKFSMRFFESSIVQDVLTTERVDTILFNTENSEYKLRFKEVSREGDTQVGSEEDS